MSRPSLQFLAVCILAATASAEDSSDCLSEYKNAKSSEGFCARCRDETGGSPLILRCSLCTTHCTVWTTFTPPLPPTPSDNDETSCALNGAETADDLLNSLVYIWAAVERCGEHGNAVQCSVDVNSAIESVNHMINVILKAVHKCGGALQGAHAKCGMAVGELTQSLAGLAAKSSGIVEHCPNDFQPKYPKVPVGAVVPTPGPHNVIIFRHKFAHCLIDMKSLIKSVIKASMRLVTLKDNCKENPQGRGCARNIMQVVGSLAEMGEFIAGTVGHCSQPTNGPAACASEILGLLRELDGLGGAGQSLQHHCMAENMERLYLEGDDVEQGTKSNFVILGMAALMPIAAVLSFVMGRRIGMAGSTRTILPDAESHEMLEASEE